MKWNEKWRARTPFVPHSFVSFSCLHSLYLTAHSLPSHCSPSPTPNSQKTKWNKRQGTSDARFLSFVLLFGCWCEKRRAKERNTRSFTPLVFFVLFLLSLLTLLFPLFLTPFYLLGCVCFLLFHFIVMEERSVVKEARMKWNKREKH